MALFVSPLRGIRNRPLRAVVVSERAVPGARLVGIGPDGQHTLTVVARGGPPYWWFAEVKTPKPGRHRFALLSSSNEVMACGHRRVEVKRGDPPVLPAEVNWKVRGSWTRLRENLYSAWVEKLFDAPPDQRPSWTPLHKVLRDPDRNFLYNHLGANEDGPGRKDVVVSKPDCADLPYFLRAYFAWKMRLPFGYRHCDRGSSARPARCRKLRTNLSEAPLDEDTASPARRFSLFLRRKVSYVHSGSGRTGPNDDETDMYPLALTRADLRPGSIYVDPYGHLLVVSRWVNQDKEKSGALFAVDGHPDLSVGRKRFWRGAFLFSADTTGGAGGFKAFRPLVLKDGDVVPLSNEEIAKSPQYGNYSKQQYKNGNDGFYDRIDALINPKPLSPKQAMARLLGALYELVLERVDSVAAGEIYMAKTRYKTMKMPSGPRIFETRGPWEDFSTPARDFRLLIAIDQVTGFPAKVQRMPDRFTLSTGKDAAAVRTELEQQIKAFAVAHAFTYTRSDGKPHTLTLAQLLERQKELEVAYNPNDCVEIRWVAKGDEEMATCKRRAPNDQRESMAKYRSWFATRNRPPIR